MINDPKILSMALVGGLIPSILWLWFWLKEDKENPEPKGLLAGVFILGMLAVALVIPFQKFIQTYFSSYEFQIILWAAGEEIVKYLAVIILLTKTSYIDEPIDWPIYLMTAALGFAALENAMFLIKPLSLDQATVGLLTGHLRFLGSTLLHTVASGALGVSLGLALGAKKSVKKIHLVVGLLFAIALHSTFNFLIIEEVGSDVVKALGFLWVAAIVVMLLFEKLRRMGGH
ncbi:MAG TPA: PrsW family glutamic-type intramembrane protease [Candidatus Paceibacterota bacterium]|nr:PrsW family glutamic-type intramembrane protease [Candidatus Paceibacterota bacterium]